jgi:bacillithiol biosynthesis deacetylase BshB1
VSGASPYGVDVLAIGPHPDDVEIFCGGVLIHLKDLGHATGVADLTRGELSTHGSVDERAREAEAAAQVLGLSFRENLGLPDGFIGEDSDGAHLHRVVEVLRRRRPELLLIPWVEDRHPDHAAASALLDRAVFFAGLRRFETPSPSERFAPRQVLYYAMRHRMRGTFIVDTTSAWERKVAAISCHASQVLPPAGVPTLIGSRLALPAIEARDRYHGSMIGTSFGEALRSPAALGISDPVALFRTNPPGQAHAFEPLR